MSSFDYTPIRDRLMKLKKDAGLDAVDFCRIYAPEILEKSESNARNYISALSTGRGYPDDRHGPLKPDIEHLQNIVNSDIFPNVTLNYLVYGDETPAKTIKELDLNIEHWTIADLCKFLGNLMDKYPYNIRTDNCTAASPEDPNDDFDYTEAFFVIKFLKYMSINDSYIDLGMALQEFSSAYEDMKKIPSETARKTMYEQLIKAIESDERFSKQYLSDCDKDSFTDGQEVNGLKIQ